MDFDHRDPSEKRFRVTAGCVMLLPRDRLLAEIAKCDVVCANCHRMRTRQRADALTPRIGTSKYLERKRAMWQAHARLLDELRSAPCADCGGRFPPCAMDFDHRDPATKRSAVTRLFGRAGVGRILAEAAKCDIVCANCHRLRTFDRRSQLSARE
jgi:formate-dependent nitrite reductase cytochrome c552 subunit